MVSRRWPWNTDKIVSLIALFISIGTFVIFLYQARLLNEQTHFLK